MTRSRVPNTYIRTIEIPVYPIYVHLRLSSFLQFNTQYIGKSSSRFFPSPTRGERQVYFYAFYAKYIIITFVIFPRSLYLHTSRRYTCKLYLRFFPLNLLVPVSETVRYSWS